MLVDLVPVNEFQQNNNDKRGQTLGGNEKYVLAVAQPLQKEIPVHFPGLLFF